MKVLVDTSVWVAHFKHRNEQLVELLEREQVVCHPSIVIEVACGTPPNRRAVLGRLAELEAAPVANIEEVLDLIERQALHRRGCGMVDIGLLAATLIAENMQLWTYDKRLQTIAADLGCEYSR